MHDIKALLAAAVILAAAFVSPASSAAEVACPVTLDFHKRTLDGDRIVHLCDTYRNMVVLVVNTASRCGFTYQYEGLEALYARYRDRGFVVLGFPSNDFGGQEPGTEAQIKTFCRLTYGVKFPMFEKTRAARGDADALFAALAGEAGEYPRWNFHKYLLDRTGKVVGSFPSRVEPDDIRIVAEVESLL